MNQATSASSIPHAASRVPHLPSSRSICFVTGTRAEFGLMVSTLRAIQAHPALRLQLIATGMHLDRRLGRTLQSIGAEGFRIDATIPWPRSAESDRAHLARYTGKAIASFSTVFAKLQPDIVLLVGDRVEAFAAATAAHLSGIPIAHVHGGDRALGQVDDALRHAISKLAHIHFPATAESAQRLCKMGEDRWRIHRVGSPGLDGIRAAAMASDELRDSFGLMRHHFALLVLHPASPDIPLESRRAAQVLRALEASPIPKIVVIYPNNDPGSPGILRQLDRLHDNPRYLLIPNAPRPLFLALLRDAAVLLGNSSAGIIESASFRTPTLDIGPRQRGRQRSANSRHLPYDTAQLMRALSRIWNNGRPQRSPAGNVYGGGHASQKIAQALATLPLSERLRQKLIAY
jgi:UDP-hydrolysing UDP-N-acetyl-D-glucosamine 2-epimerase